jgi:LmbE family N-acetylglucosaminyl deacetylase
MRLLWPDLEGIPLSDATPSPVAPDAEGGTVLVFSVHPDDAAIVCAGPIRKAVRDGGRVVICCLTHLDAQGLRRGIESRSELLDAAHAFGIKEDDVLFLGYPEGQLAPMWAEPKWDFGRPPYNGCLAGGITRNAENLTLVISDLVDGLMPNRILLPHPEDDHADHKTAYWAILAAVRRATLLARPPHMFSYLVSRGQWPPAGSRFDAPALDRHWPLHAVWLDGDQVEAKTYAIAAHTNFPDRMVHDRYAPRHFLRENELFWLLPATK